MVARNADDVKVRVCAGAGGRGAQRVVFILCSVVARKMFGVASSLKLSTVVGSCDAAEPGNKDRVNNVSSL